MDWEAIGAIGQVLGSLAVFVTFGYLSVQVRHAREAMQNNVVRARLDGSRELYLAQATNPQLASAYVRLRASTGSPPLAFTEYALAAGLSDVEARLLFAYSFAGWQNFEASIESIERLSSGVRDELDRVLRFNYGASAPMAKWYEMMKSNYLNPNAVRYVDNVLAREA